VGNPPPLQRSLLALPGLTLRRDWLYAQVKEQKFEEFAEEIAALCDAAERLDPSAKEALVPFVVLLAWRGLEPWVEPLRRYAVETSKPSLLRLLRVYGIPPYYEERSTQQKTGPRGKEIPLGERKSLARRPNRRVLERLLTDPHPQVIRHLLGNPHLTEMDIVALLSVRPGRSATIETLAEFPNWLVCSKIRMAITYHPASPSHITVPLVALATRPELQEIADSPSVHVVLRATAQEFLERHPPLGPADSATLQ
jgi:hypothetical protein